MDKNKRTILAVLIGAVSLLLVAAIIIVSLLLLTPGGKAASSLLLSGEQVSQMLDESDITGTESYASEAEYNPSGAAAGSSGKVTGNSTAAGTGSVVKIPQAPSNAINIFKEAAMKPASAKVPDRATSSNIRMVVNNENPMFLFFPRINTSNPNDVSGLKMSLDILPEDVRKYSAFVLWGVTYRETNESFYQAYQPLLAECDRLGVKAFIISEFWNTANNDDVVGGNQTVPMLYEKDIDRYYQNHPSFMGMVHFELSAMVLQKNEIDRLKESMKSAVKNKGIVLWFEGGSAQVPAAITDSLNRDEEFFNLCRSNPKNIIFIDKENGHGMRFSNTSSAMGAWIADCSDNWGVAFENWSWWEEGMGKRWDMGGSSRKTLAENGVGYYPYNTISATALQKIAAGASVFTSHEAIRMFTNYFGNQEKTSPGFDEMLYPIYQKILTEKTVPTKSEVKSRIKVAYQVTNATNIDANGKKTLVIDNALRRTEAPILIDLYGPGSEHVTKWEPMGITKKWLPTTGRYYVMPYLTKRVDAAKVLPGASVINAANYDTICKTKESKLDFFNKLYPQTYTGTSYMFQDNVKNRWYFFNPNENTQINTTSTCKLMNNNKVSLMINIANFTTGELLEKADGLRIDMNNLEMDLSLLDASINAGYSKTLENFYNRKNISQPALYKDTYIEIGGLSKQPQAEVQGNNNAAATMTYENGTAKIYIRSNGRTVLNLKY